ncbi:MAG: hypothetical protein EOO43_16790, partial [Flavobacterium sp.]
MSKTKSQMKHHLLSFILILSSALFLSSCALKEPVVKPHITNEYSIIDGDTVRTVITKDYKKIQALDPNSKNYILVGDTIIIYQEPKLHTPPASAPDLSNLKNNENSELKGKPLRMIDIGGSLTAGVRDGGYFNEGIMTSYPNLIARQMHLSRFEQPLFDKDNYNGFGRKVITGFNPTGGPVPKFNEVTNNSAIVYADDKTLTLKSYQEKEALDNFAIPNMSRAAYMGHYSNLSETSRRGKEAFYLRIVENERTEPLWKKVVSQKADIAIVELRQTEVMNNLLGGNDVIGVLAEERDIMKTAPYNPSETSFLSAELFLLRKLEEQKGLKVVLMNVPDFSKIVYTNSITPQTVKRNLGDVPIYFDLYSYNPTT